MPVMYDKRPLPEKVKDCLSNKFQEKDIMKAQDVFYKKRNDLVNALPQWQDFREEAKRIRDHVLDNLDYYVDEFATNAEKSGAKVHFAFDAKDATDQILEIMKQANAKMAVKSKTILSEEISVNEALQEAGYEINETDLGEYILQVADSPPSHIVVPALHFERHEIKEIFAKNAGYTGDAQPEDMTKFVREHIRNKFLQADVGFTGCNFGVCSTGSLTLVSNEGNGRMSSSIPKIQIAIVGIERLVPDLESLDVMMEVLIRSAVGSKTCNYFSVITGPAKPGECDGPEELHIVLVDNGRTDILGNEFNDILRCIRCGACMNICPVYRHITGHGYGSIYPGPIGAVLTPLLVGYEDAGELPYASTLCGACTENCPVKIPLHELLMKHRVILADKLHRRPKAEQLAVSTVGKVFANENLYNLATKAGAVGMGLISRDGKLPRYTAHFPVIGAWTKNRDMKKMSLKKFRDVYKEYKRKQGK